MRKLWSSVVFTEEALLSASQRFLPMTKQAMISTRYASYEEPE